MTGLLNLMMAIEQSPHNMAVRKDGAGRWVKVWERDEDMYQVDISERGKPEAYGDDLAPHDVHNTPGLAIWLYEHGADPRYGWEPVR